MLEKYINTIIWAARIGAVLVALAIGLFSVWSIVKALKYFS